MNRQEKALELAADMIEEGMVISLGSGSNMRALAKWLHEHPKNEILYTTPSPEMKRICREYGFKLIDARFLDHVDIAFDGCDEIDENLHAIKSFGGCHTREKIMAAMAKKFVIITSRNKYHPHLDFRQPICLEVLQPALSYVVKYLRNFGVDVTVREHPVKGNLLISEDGNYIVDLKLKPITNLKKLNQALMEIPGVVDHSLFYNQADAMILWDDEEALYIPKPDLSDLSDSQLC